MKTKYYAALNIVAHVDALAKMFPAIAEDKAEAWDRLQTLEKQAASLALRECNGWMKEGEYEKRSTALMDRVDKLLGFKALGIPVFHNGDPRGYALKVDFEKTERPQGFHTDFGGYGILAPDFTGN